MQTGCAGVFAGGDMVPFDRTVTTAVGHGKKAARTIDAWLRVDGMRARRRSTSWPASRCCVSGITPKRRSAARAPSTSNAGGRRSTRSSAGLDRRRGAIRGPALPVVRQLLRVRRLLLGLPGAGRRSSSDPGRRYEYDLDKCTGCAICYDQCPCGAIAMVAGSDAVGSAHVAQTSRPAPAETGTP